VIPHEFHFVWFGRAFPFTHALAIRSVHVSNAPAAIHLHCSDDLTGQPHYDALVRDVPSLRARPLALEAMLADCEGTFDVPAMRQIYRELEVQKRWAALSDVIRYLVLLREGGVYLDMDVLVVRDLRPLLTSAAFCGLERLLVDAALYRSKLAWMRFPRTAPLDLARSLCAKAEQGIAWWKRIERLYVAAVNGAVLGAVPGHPLMSEALREIPRLIPTLERRRPAIGPDLLQDLVGWGRRDVTVLPPAAFYPLGPTMAAQYFKQRVSVAAAAAQVLAPETYVLHWYNDNLRSLARPPDAESVASLRETQLFSHFAAPFLPAMA
jgi:hypothetical protein